MLRNLKQIAQLNILAGVLALMVSPAAAQSVTAQSSLASGHAAIQLRATVPAQLQLSLADISLDIKVADPSQNSAVVSVPVTSSWVLDSTTSNVELVGYFDSPAVAMTDNAGHAIPASRVLGGLAEEAMAPFVESSRVGTANASRTFYRQSISQQNVVSSRADTLNVQLSSIADLGAPAAEYRGILHLRLVSY